MSLVTICPFCSVALFDPKLLAPHIELIHRCPLCPIRLPGQPEREAHIRIIHGKIEVPPEPLRFRDILTAGPEFDDVLDWRSPVEGISIPESVEDRVAWLYPFCLRIVKAAYPEAAWTDVPESLREPARYAEFNFPSTLAALEIKRYKRLKSAEAKGQLLARALALPERKASYADQRVSQDIRAGLPTSEDS